MNTRRPPWSSAFQRVSTSLRGARSIFTSKGFLATSSTNSATDWKIFSIGTLPKPLPISSRPELAQCCAGRERWSAPRYCQSARSGCGGKGA